MKAKENLIQNISATSHPKSEDFAISEEMFSSDRRQKILVVGSSVVDLTFYTKSLPKVGETLKGEFQQGLGGKGFNQAVAAARAGASVRFLSALGPLDVDPFAKLFISRAEALMIDARFQFIEGYSSGAAAISVDESGQNQIIVSLGANEKLSSEFLEQNSDFFSGVDIFLTQFEIPLSIISHSIQMIRKYSPRAKVILNPAPAFSDIPGEILREVDFLTPNETELQCLSDLPTGSKEEIRSATSKWLQKCGADKPRAIIVTRGESGSLFLNCSTHLKSNENEKLESQEIEFKAHLVKALDTAGAGDAFNGSFAAGLQKSLQKSQGKLKEAIQYANVFSALSVTKRGTSASMPEHSEVVDFLYENKYPSHWWKTVPDVGVPEWEILPQFALPGEVILSKRNELGLLSNFAHTPFEFRGKKYQSVEGFWQMLFFPEAPQDLSSELSSELRGTPLNHAALEWPWTRKEVSQMLGHEAFAAGVVGFANMKRMGINYVTFEGRPLPYWVFEKSDHFKLIFQVMQAKLKQNPKVEAVLKSTKGLRLRPDHFEPSQTPPSWKYYEIWMELRDQLID